MVSSVVGSSQELTGYAQDNVVPKGPLYGKRPRVIQEAIEARYQEVLETTYQNNGKSEYRLELMDTIASSDAILGKIVSKDSELLDLGTGNGEFLLHAEEKFGVRATGITAEDMRDPQKGLISDQQYLLGNIENISSWLRKTYNHMIASWLFLHFVDPLGTMEELYDNHLEVGGYMIIHKMHVHCGDQKNPVQFMEELVEHLNRTGNCRAAVGVKMGQSVLLGVPMGRCDFFFIQKLNDQPLDLPVQFLEKPISNLRNDKVSAAYQIDPSRNVQKCDEKGKAMVGCQSPLEFFN